MAEAFTQEADFSGITADPQGLMIESILNKATIDVDEEGTVATASMAPGMTIGALSFPIFRADHPFLLLLRGVNTGIRLFIGKVIAPTMAPIVANKKRYPYTSLIKTLADRLGRRR